MTEGSRGRRRARGVGLIACGLIGWTALAPAQDVSNLRARSANEDARVDPSGITDSAQGLTALLGAGQVSLKLPCGTYLIGQTLALPSHTELYGADTACVVIKMKQGMPPNPQLKYVANRTEYTIYNKTIIANSAFQAGNSDIHIHDLTIDISGVSDKRVVWLAYFHNISGLRIEHVKFVGSRSVAQSGGVGVLGNSSHVSVKSSSFSGLQGGGACVSVWDGTRDVLAQDNDCEGSGTLNFGVQANGSAAAAGAFRPAGDIKFIHNVVKNVRVVGIDIDGLCNAKRECGEVVGAQVLGNDIEKSGLWGVRVGHASHVEIADNKIKDIQRDGVAIVNQVDAAMVPLHDVTVERNVIENPDLAKSGDNAGIRVGNTGDAPFDIHLRANKISGHAGLAAVRFHRGPAFSGEGAIKGAILTISRVGRGSLVAGERLSGPGVAPETRVLRQISGEYGGVGAYEVDRRQETNAIRLEGAPDEAAGANAP